MTYLVEEGSYSVRTLMKICFKNYRSLDIQSEHRTLFTIPKSKHIGNGREERGKSIG